MLRSARTALAAALLLAATGALAADRPYKILHIMSYNASFNWSEQQHVGFKEALAGIAAEHRVFEMDVDRHRGVANWSEKTGGEARALIDEWQPDLVYTTDDAAQEHVAKHYVNRNLPFVYSGVDRDPQRYGFVGARNVAGVPEHVHIVETLRLMQSVVPGVKRIVVVSDPNPMGAAVAAKIKARLHEAPGVEVVGWETVLDFEAYKRVVQAYASKADGLCTLAIGSMKDKRGNVVSRAEVMRWTFDNSALPDITLWDERVTLGALLAVTVSGREQGRAAGRIARAILVEGKSPASFPMQPAGKGVPMINIARARKLGLKLSSTVLLSAEVVTHPPTDRD